MGLSKPCFDLHRAILIVHAVLGSLVFICIRWLDLVGILLEGSHLYELKTPKHHKLSEGNLLVAYFFQILHSKWHSSRHIVGIEVLC